MGALSQQFPLRLMDWTKPWLFRALRYSAEAYWHPRSECSSSPGPGRWRWIAMVSAASGNSVRRWSRMAQPTTFRLNRSRMAATYNQPSSVAT